MEPKFQTSFIPKTPITGTNSAVYKSDGSFSIFGTGSTVLFVLALLLSGGLFGYKTYVNKEVEKSELALSQARSAFQSEDNQKVILASDQLKSIKTLLNNHKLVSPVFELLEQQTLPTVRLISFAFSRDSTGDVTLSLELEAQSYGSLAQQSKIFSELEYLKQVEFSGIGLSDVGAVRAKVSAKIDQNILLYTKKLQSVSVSDNSSLEL